MRPTNLGLLFSVILVCFIVIDDIKTMEIAQLSNMQIKYNNALDNAVFDAMTGLVELDSGREKVINKEEAVKQFFSSVAINFGIMEAPNLKKMLINYVPVIGIIVDDGFYLYHSSMEIEKGELLGDKSFTGKIRYEKEWEDYLLYYTLSDYVSVINKKTGERLEGDYHDVYQVYPLEILANSQTFEEERRKSIIQLLTKTISYYIVEHNRIAKRWGITYEFSLPVIEEEEWYRTIDDISMIAFFQGYPYGNHISGYYNRVVISGARLRKE